MPERRIGATHASQVGESCERAWGSCDANVRGVGGVPATGMIAPRSTRGQPGRAVRALVAVAICLTASGCYLSHRLPGDGGAPPDAPCEAPPREIVTIEIEILEASPRDCSRVGTTYTVETDLSGGPLYPDCPDSRSTLTADGCGLAVEARCLGVEYERELQGTLRGAGRRARIEAFQRVGYAFAPCDRVEAWRIVE